jgi:hypothetical protein
VVSAVAFTRDNRLACACWDGTVRLQMDPDAAGSGGTARQVWREERTREAASAGRWLAAAFHLSRLIDADPHSASLHARRGLAYCLQGQWERGARDLREPGALDTILAGAGPTVAGISVSLTNAGNAPVSFSLSPWGDTKIILGPGQSQMYWMPVDLRLILGPRESPTPLTLAVWDAHPSILIDQPAGPPLRFSLANRGAYSLSQDPDGKIRNHYKTAREADRQ